MGLPAARITDMHLCPMITPGVPPIPHVGGPILGPGVPTVLIGKMPAVVMGDMCTCVGPPDTIVKGSTGVMIGGRPAARMGDLTVHGGSIVFGFPTVLIGEVGAPSAVNLSVSPVTVVVGPVVIPPIVFQNMPAESAQTLDQITSMQNAADEALPFCEICPLPGSNSDEGSSDEEEIEPEKKLKKFYITDKQGNKIKKTMVGTEVYLVVKTENMIGETININISNKHADYIYNDTILNDDVLTGYTITQDTERILLKVVTPLDIQKSEGSSEPVV